MRTQVFVYEKTFPENFEEHRKVTGRMQIAQNCQSYVTHSQTKKNCPGTHSVKKVFFYCKCNIPSKFKRSRET